MTVHYANNTNNEPMDSYMFLSSKSYIPIIPNNSIVIIMSIVKKTADKITIMYIPITSK